MTHKENCASWYRRNKALTRERAKARYLANPEKYREACKRYYVKRREATIGRVRKRKYGITNEGYLEMHASQNGVCAICHNACTCGRKLAVDHDHKTGVIRGLLCSRCNRGLGLFKESPDYLEAARNYLLKHEKAEIPPKRIDFSINCCSFWV